MYIPCYNALTWATLLLPFFVNINTVFAQWEFWHFQIQPYFLLDFWTIGPDYVTEFVLILEQRPVNGRSAHYAQALQRGPANRSGEKSLHTSVTSSSSISGTTASSSSSPESSESASYFPSVSQSSSTSSSHPSLDSSSASSSFLSTTSTTTSLSSSASPFSSTKHPSSSVVASTPSATSGVYGDSSLNTTNKGMLDPVKQTSERIRGYD